MSHVRNGFIALIILFTLFLGPNSSYAQSIQQKSNVPVNKIWTIHFSTSMNQESINKDSIYILKENGNKVDTVSFRWTNPSTLKIVNNSPYIYDHTYELHIKNNVMSSRNKRLTKSTYFTFTTQSKPEVLPIQEIIEENDPTVVMIKSDDSQGSGVLVGEGLILTNEHVISGMESGSVTFNNGNSINIEGIVKADTDKDLALIKTEENPGIKPVEIGNPDLLKKGDSIVTIGNPMSLQNTASTGTVSGFRNEDFEAIQITAPITHGSSGGGLFNKQGELVGVTSYGLGESGNLNFAISINEVKEWATVIDSSFEEIEPVSLDAPVNIEANLLPFGGVNVIWDKVADADYYNVYYSIFPSGPYHALQSIDGDYEINTSSFYDIDIDYISFTQTYYYSVSAVKDGIESPISGAAKVQIPPVFPEDNVSVELGMTRSEIKNNETGTLTNESEDQLIYKGLTPLAYQNKTIYTFKNEILVKIEENTSLPNYTNPEDIHMLKSRFEQLIDKEAHQLISEDNTWDSDGIGSKWDIDTDDEKGKFSINLVPDKERNSSILRTIYKGRKIDNTHPYILNSVVTSPTTLKITFNEDVRFTHSAEEFLNNISATNLNTTNATAEIDESILEITLDKKYSLPENYQASDMRIKSDVIEDMAGLSLVTFSERIKDRWVSDVQQVSYQDIVEDGGSSANDIGIEFSDIGTGDESESPYDISGYYLVAFNEGVNHEEAEYIIQDSITQEGLSPFETGAALMKNLDNTHSRFIDATAEQDGSLITLRSNQLLFNGSSMNAGTYEVFVIAFDRSLNFSLSENTTVTIGD